MINYIFVLCLIEMIIVCFEFIWYEYNGLKLKEEGGCYLWWLIWIDNKVISIVFFMMKIMIIDIYFVYCLLLDYNIYGI